MAALTPKDIHDRLAGVFGPAILEYQDIGTDPATKVKAESLLDIAAFLASDPDLSFDMLLLVSGCDYGPGKPLGAVYHIYSHRHLHRVVIKVDLPRDNPVVPSVVAVWRGADWLERETFDMYGITFEGHPDHRRILCPDDWDGWPLRKDYVVQEYYQGVRVPYAFSDRDRHGTVIQKKGLE